MFTLKLCTGIKVYWKSILDKYTDEECGENMYQVKRGFIYSDRL